MYYIINHVLFLSRNPEASDYRYKTIHYISDSLSLSNNIKTNKKKSD